MIGNDTYALTLDAGYLTGAALALALYRPSARPLPELPAPRRDQVLLNLARTNALLRNAVRHALGAHRTGQDRIGWAILTDVADV
jgi:hypothetical protein